MIENEKPDEDLIVVYSAANLQEAHLLKGLLAQREIDAVVLNEALGAATGGVPVGQATSPRIGVAQADEAKARQVVVAFERQQQIGPPQVDDIFPHNEDSEPWPVCPSCGRQRETMCRTCGVAGTDFPEADYQVVSMEPATQQQGASCGCGSTGSCAGDEPEPVQTKGVGQPTPLLLMCETCDEVFQPRFYRICPWCDHDFGTGIEPPDPSTKEDLNSRTKFVLALMGIGFFALLVYLLYMMAS